MSETQINERGLQAEYHIIAELNQNGIPHEYTDTWCDVILLGKTPLEMTSSDTLKCVVSRLRSVPRKPLNINLSPFGVGQGCPKVLLCGFAKGTSHEKITKTTFIGGGLYDCESIQTFQPIELQPRCEDSNSENRKSLQIQH